MWLCLCTIEKKSEKDVKEGKKGGYDGVFVGLGAG